MPSGGVVEPFDVVEDAYAGLDSDPEAGPVQELGLEAGEERLGNRVDAPIVKYCGSGGGDGVLSGSVVCHDVLVDLAGEEPFQAADDVLLREAFGGAASDVVHGGLVESHSYYGDSVERCVGLAVPASAGDDAGWFVRMKPGWGRCRRVSQDAASERIRSGLSPNTMRTLGRRVGSDSICVS